MPLPAILPTGLLGPFDLKKQKSFCWMNLLPLPMLPFPVASMTPIIFHGPLKRSLTKRLWNGGRVLSVAGSRNALVKQH